MAGTSRRAALITPPGCNGRSVAESALCLLGHEMPYIEDYTGTPAEIVREYTRRHPLTEQPARQDIADAAAGRWAVV